MSHPSSQRRGDALNNVHVLCRWIESSSRLQHGFENLLPLPVCNDRELSQRSEREACAVLKQGFFDYLDQQSQHRPASRVLRQLDEKRRHTFRI